MELILRLSAKHSNNKQTPRRLANLSGYFLEDSWVLSSQAGATTAAETHALHAYLQSYVNQRFSVTLSNKPQALKFVKVLLHWYLALLHWSVLGKPAICIRLSECLVQTRQGGEDHISIWNQKGFHAFLPKHRMSPGEAAVDISKSKTNGHSCELLLPRESFFFFFKEKE